MADSASAQPCKGLTWGYDAWGNRTDQNLTSGSCNTFHASVDTNNRLTGSPYTYDAAGNMTHDGSHSYTYDAEGHLATVDGGSTASYVYDASGLRVQKTVAGTPVNYLYDLSGKTLVEISGSGSVITDYAYLGGQFVAEYSAGTTYFVHQDHLGSARLMTRLDKSIYDSLDYLPYGEQIAGATGTTHKFTSDERDGTSASETGLDHTQFRQYSSFIGRWPAPDPADLAAANLAFPQSWNRYAYVMNNPLSLVDPTGLMCQYLSDDGSSTESIDYQSDPNACRFTGGEWIEETGGAMFGNSSLLPGQGTCATLGGALVGYSGSENGSVPRLTNPGYSDPSLGGTNAHDDSWAWTFTKTFVSNVFSPTFYKQELRAGGCLRTFFEGVDEADVLGPVLNGSPNFAETAIKGQAATFAFNYAASQNLIRPLSNTAVKGILETGETAAGAFGPAYLVGQETWGLYREISAAGSGACH